MKPIYLDYNATTPVDVKVAETIRSLADDFGNPSSTHVYGRQAHHTITEARLQVAHILHAQPDEIVFTSGGSESNNLAIAAGSHNSS